MHAKRLMPMAVLCALLGSMPADTAAQVGIRTAALKSVCYDFAMNPSTGDLAAIDNAASTVTLYPKACLAGTADAVVGPTKVGNKPVSILFKRYKDKSYYLVGCAADAQMWVLDAGTLKVVRRVGLGAEGAYSLGGGGDPDDPVVYYAFGSGHGGMVGYVDLSDFTDKGKTGVEGMDLAASADGNLLYTRGPWSPSGSQVSRRWVGDDGKLSWQSLYWVHRDCPGYLADPFSLYTASGLTLFTADLKTQVTKLPGVPLCFFKSRPVIITFDGRSIQAVSYNTFKQFGSVPVPDVFKSRDRYGDETGITQSFPSPGWLATFRRGGPFLRAFADPGADRVVLAAGNHALLLPLAQLGVTPEPMMLLKVSPPEALFVDQPIAIPVAPMDKRVKVTLASGPQGLRLADGQLTWTPKSTQVGTATVKLAASHGEVTREQEVALKVARPHVRLPFEPSGLAVSPDGKLAVCWINGRERNEWGDRVEKTDTRVALVDLATLKLLAHKTLANPISAVAVDEHFVYVGAEHSSLIDLLAHKDLSRAKRSFTTAKVRDIVPLSGKRLYVNMGDSARLYSLPGFEIKATLPGGGGSDDRGYYRDNRDRPARAPYRLPDGWYYHGVVYGRDFEKVLAIVQPPDMPSLDIDRSDRPEAPLPWGRQLGRTAQDQQVRTAGGQQVGAVKGDAVHIMPDHPVAVALSAQGDQRLIVQLTLHDLVSAKATEPVRLLDEPQGDPQERYRRPGFNRESTGVDLTSAGALIVARFKDRLFTYALDAGTLKGFARPLGFQLAQPALTLDAAASSTLEHVVRGGQPPCEFDLTTTDPALKVDAASGRVIANGPLLARKAALKAAGDLMLGLRRGRYEATTQPDAIEDALNEGIQRVAEGFRQLVGRPPRGLPVLVPIGLKVSDSQQQTASLAYYAFLEVPEAVVMAPVKAEIARLRAEAEKAQAEEARRRAEYEARRRQYEQRSQPAAGEGIDKRLAELEERVKKIEAKIDLLLEMMVKRDKQ